VEGTKRPRENVTEIYRSENFLKKRNDLTTSKSCRKLSLVPSVQNVVLLPTLFVYLFIFYLFLYLVAYSLIRVYLTLSLHNSTV
jgi:hypothetical protein